MFTLQEIDRLIPFSSFANFALNPGLEFKFQLMELLCKIAAGLSLL